MSKAGFFSPAGGESSAQFDEFRRFFRQELGQSGIVGGSFVFLQDNRLLAREFFGTANLETGRPVDEDTIYHWASNTKPFTAIAVMQLRDRGLLDLEDTVIEYLPELKTVHNRFGAMSEITVRHLMNHTSGFRETTFPWSGGRDWQPFEPPGYEQIRAMLPYSEIEFEPGSRFGYSNLGYVFLGRIVELLTNDDYEVYVDKNIFKPLGMHRSYFDATPGHLLKFRSHGYYVREGQLSAGQFDADSGATVANSGLNSPVPDMIRYLDFLTGDPARQEIHECVLRRSSLEEMFRPTVETDADANGNRGFTTDVGLAFFLDRRGGRSLIGHGGDQNGFISYIEFDPETRAASILVFNTNVLQTAGETQGEDVFGRLRLAVRGLFESLNK